MASSYLEYTGDGAQTNWSVSFPYLDTDHVHFFVDGVEVTSGVSWPNAGTISVTPAVANGAAILIQRTTPDAALVTFSNRQAVNESNLSTATLQAIYRAVEAADRSLESITTNTAGLYDFGGRRATNLGAPVDPTDVVSKGYADTILDATTAAKNSALAAQSAAETANAAAATHETNASTDATNAAADAASAAASVASIDTPTIVRTTNNLNDLADKAVSRTNLGVAIGTDVEAYDANTAKLNVAQTWAAVQGYAPQALTYAASQTWDVSVNPSAELSPTGNVTSFSVSGAVAGRTYMLKNVQDSTDRSIAYDVASFKFIGGEPPVLSSGSGAVDYHVFRAVSATLLHEIGRAQGVA